MPVTVPKPLSPPSTHREVSPPLHRRIFSKFQKEAILRQAEQCTETGQIGALLRREGIYASYLTAWRREQAAGWRKPTRGRPNSIDHKAQELSRLQRENASLKDELSKVQMILDMQKKMTEFLFPGSKPLHSNGSC